MTVKIYTTNHCPWCHKAKDFLKRHNIKFENIDVQENEEAAREMVEKSGQMGVPVLDINGEIIVGFNETRIRKALGIKE
jgi:glutaredoxin 3